MKKTKRQLLTIAIGLLFLIPLGYRFYQENKGHILGARVEAVGNLLITYLGVPLGDPVFNVTNMLPGDCQTRTIDVQNSGLTTTKVAVKSRNEQDPDLLSTQLHITISQNSIDLYGGTATTSAKTVKNFFDESQIPDEIYLADVAPNQTTSFQFQVCFDPQSGNQFQNASTIFDLVFGEISTDIPVELPEICKSLEGIVTEKIVGTNGDDVIKGTSASEYIIGKDGNDIIEGGGGHDCIIGGAGDDDIDAGSGNDIVVGRAGNDHLDGHSDNDLIYGNAGDDFIEGKHGYDTIYAGGGADTVRAGSDNDLVYGGAGADDLDGDSGDDTVYGQGGPDLLHGSSGNDYLDGGSGTDDLDGDSGDDTCVNGETLNSCEL